jgi:hypothetical protein
LLIFINKMKTLFNGLINIDLTEDMDNFIDNLNKDVLFKLIESAINVAQLNGQYTLEESFIIYKTLNKLKTNE